MGKVPFYLEYLGKVMDMGFKAATRTIPDESDAIHYSEDSPVADSDNGHTASPEREMCGHCNGSGEGQYEGTKCSRCGGSGELLTEEEEEEKEYAEDRMGAMREEAQEAKKDSA